MRIKLGQKVRDVVTGLNGIAICRTEWLAGCIRVTVQPAAMKDGKLPECQTLDEDQLEVVAAALILPGRKTDIEIGPQRFSRTGGGRPDPAPRKDPAR